MLYMNNIHVDKLKKYLVQKLHSCYILLGEDLFLLNKNQDLILNFANKKGFIEKKIVNIETNQDWNKIIDFYKKKSLFFKKTILIINFIIKNLNITLINNINQISFFLNSDVLTILKFNHLSFFIQKNKLLDKLKCYSNTVSCFTPYGLFFINWVQYEISEKNINIEQQAFFLLCKYYEGNTLFICQILDILLLTWPNTCITVENIKKVIIDFFIFSPLHWINAIFEGKIKKSIYILNIFYKKKYDPLILIRSLQKDLLILIYMKREKKININAFLKKNNIWNIRYPFFINAFKNIQNHTFLKAIQILVKIEINIKKKYNYAVWDELKELNLMICSETFYILKNKK